MHGHLSDGCPIQLLNSWARKVIFLIGTEVSPRIRPADSVEPYLKTTPLRRRPPYLKPVGFHYRKFLSIIKKGYQEYKLGRSTPQRRSPSSCPHHPFSFLHFVLYPPMASASSLGELALFECAKELGTERDSASALTGDRNHIRNRQG